MLLAMRCRKLAAMRFRILRIDAGGRLASGGNWPRMEADERGFLSGELPALLGEPAVAPDFLF